MEGRSGWPNIYSIFPPSSFPNSFFLCHQTTRILNSSCCTSVHVTKIVTWEYLGNQAWYHRSKNIKKSIVRVRNCTGVAILKSLCVFLSFFLFVFLSSCPIVFLSFCLSITVIKCLKGIKCQKSPFVSKFKSGTQSVTHQGQV